MILLSGADVVLPDRILSPGTVAIDGDRVVDVLSGARAGGQGDVSIDLAGRIVAPGFVDVHVHGVGGIDALDGGDAILRIARALPQYGVTAFCPTSIACEPSALRRMLASIRDARTSPLAGARVLPAHLESNFINPEYTGAQPLDCLRSPRSVTSRGSFTGDDILDEIAAAGPDVGIVTMAPELDGAMDLIADLVRHGHHVSLGHSGASYEQAIAAVEAGARQATHLFNRMPPMSHRAPGLAGAMLEHEAVAAEVICDGVHVHPAMVRVALAAKRPERFMAVTDGTAGSGLARGSVASLGGRRITVRDAAYLDDGTLAGSVLTMDGAFAMLVGKAGATVIDAVMACSTTPARQLGLHGLGVVAPGAIADLVVLGRDFTVLQTYVAGVLVYEAGPVLSQD
jgi:N-acetylglucosamine-6-phosphate deacetylase